MAKLSSSLELSLVDKVSAGARKIDQNLENLRHQQMRSQQAFSANRDAMLATVATAYVLAQAVRAPIQASIDFSTKLEDIRQMSAISSAEIEKYGDSWRQVGLDTAQGASAITNAVSALAASGAVSIAQADVIAEPIGKTATAYGADPNDIATAAGAVMNTLKVSEQDVDKVFDILATGAMNGSVELKNLAGGFGILASSASSFGVEGTDAVADLVTMLEIAATTAGTPEKAFTNTNAFLASIQSPDVRKGFAEAGVDIVAEMNRAIENGESPFEHALGLIDKVTQGGKRDLLGDLFGREEAVNFILPLLANMEKYRADRAEAIAADGQVEKDFAARMQTPGAIMARLFSSLEELQLAVGDQLVPGLIEVAKAVTPLVDGVSDFVKANGELTSAVIQVTGALLGMKLLAQANNLLTSFPGIPGAPAPGTPGGPNPKGGPMSGFIPPWAAPIIADIVGKLAWDKLVGEDTWTPEHQAIKDGAGGRVAEMIQGMLVPRQPSSAQLPDEGLAMEIASLQHELAMLDEQLAGLPAAMDGAFDPAGAQRLVRDRLAGELASLEAEAATSGQAVGSSIQQGLSAQVPSIAAEFERMMSVLRIAAATGINIPIQMNGPRALTGPGRMIDAPGNFAPPSMPMRATGGGGASAPTIINNSFGAINIQNPTNANPVHLSRLLGDVVGKSVRAAHSNTGSMA